MQKQIKYLPLFVVFFVSTAVISCTHPSEEDVNAPVVTITSPTENASISGDVAIQGLATDESMHAMSIIVTDDTGVSQLFIATPEVHDSTSYTINELWSPGVGDPTPVILTVKVEDHSNNITVKTVHFTVNP
jgi:hypothetical protein